MFDQLRKYAAAYAVAIGGVVLTCWSSWNVREELQSSHRREFQWAASDRIESVRAVVDQGLDALREIRGLFYAAQELDESTFSAFADPILQRHPYIASLLWAPLQTAPQEEPSATVIGGVPTTTAAVKDTPLGTEREQRTRIPVVLAASRALSELAKGVDLNSSSELAALFARARESGKIAVSGRMTLARPGRNSLSVIYAALPIHAPASAQSSPAPEGFVLGVYDIEELVHFAIKRLEPRGVEVLVRDETTGDDAQFLPQILPQFLPQFIHFYPSRLEPGATATATGWLPEQDENQPRMVATIRVGDRSWTVTCVATHTFRSAEAFTEAHWSVMVTGLLFTALLSFYLVRSRRELDNRSQLAKTIFEREELLRQLAETVDVVFWAINAEATRLEYIGPAFRQLAGDEVELDSTAPSLLLDVFAPKDRRMLSEAIADLQADGGRFSLILPLSPGCRGQRNLLWLRVCGFPVRSPQHGLSRIVGFCEDITEHKLAEDALRDSETKLRTLFNHSPDLIFTVDEQARILFANRPLPHPFPDADDKRSELALPEHVRDAYLDKLRQVFASGQIEHCQYTADDASWWEIRMVPIGADNAANTGRAMTAVMVVITDITENRKLQWQAIRSARLASLGVLSAGIAHEISNPNHAIMANAPLLARIWQDALPILAEYEQEHGDFLLAGLSFAQARETISRGMADVGENARRIQKIIGNLKHLGKQDHGHMDELADIAKILKAVLTLLDARIRKESDCLTLALPEGLPPVRGNVQQLEQVFINVIVNALESLPDRSRSVKITAGLDRSASRIIVRVEDQGTGMSDEVMAQISEPFFTTKAERGGTGLGLSISSSIVEKHGGRLRFESNKSSGTTVSIYLPIVKEA
ncbi:MAG: ATP-binding protein [Candidatus Accumulibacter meliphilus]|jgi:signal transduction histidine kinase|uniref:ATP-binding protein n=1 Tax=Candidatus Accumulibacter meliphilus TaxID=2211374 RepID=UPI002FC2C7CC